MCELRMQKQNITHRKTNVGRGNEKASGTTTQHIYDMGKIYIFKLRLPVISATTKTALVHEYIPTKKKATEKKQEVILQYL